MRGLIGIMAFRFSFQISPPLTALVLGLIFHVGLTGCTASHVDMERVTLSIASDGSTDAILESLINAYEEEHPDVQTYLVTSSRAEAVAALEAGEVDAALLLGRLDAQDLFEAVVGQESLAVIVNPDNFVGDMTVEQVRAVFSGRMADWSSLGGTALPIETIIESSGSPARMSMDTLLLGGLPPAPSSRLAPDADTLLDLVAAAPGAVGWLPSSQLDRRVHAITINQVGATPANVETLAYPFADSVVLASIQEPVGPVKDFLTWIVSPEGRIVVRRYLAPPRS